METNEIKESNQSVEKVPFFKRMSKTRLIIACVSFTIILALIITTILLSVIQTRTSVKFENTPDRIVLNINSTQLTLYADDESTKDDFNLVYNSYNNVSSPTIMEAIFNGYAGRGKEAYYSQKSKSYANLATQTTYSVAFYWDSDQLMTDKNGNKFTYTMSNGEQSTNEIYYKAVFFDVSDSNSVQEKTFYIRRSTSSTTSTNFYYTGIANFNSMYQTLEQLKSKFNNYA